VELRHLKYFLAVAEERQFTRAAARLFMEQPPLSQQIRAFETELGFDVFSRLPRGVELTSAGESLATDVPQILAMLDQAIRKASRIARGELGAIAVGMTSSAAFHPLSLALVRDFRAQYPDVAIDLVELNAAEIIERMMTGAIQTAILRKPIDTPEGLHFDRLVDEQMVVVLPGAHPLAGAKRARLKQLASESFVLVRRPGAPGLYADLLTACRAAGFEPSVLQEVPRMTAAINLVAAGTGITVVPASMQRYGQHGVVYLPFARGVRLSAPLHLAYREHEPNSAAQRFVQLVQTQRAASKARTSATE
jgi:DNA-binding transcriptional LysR family regulator